MIDKPALSPDGSKIAYCSATRGHIRIFSITDSTEKNLTPEQENAYQPTWSADGKFIAFLSYQESHPDSSPPFSNQLYIIPVDGGNPVQITSGDSLKFYNLCWSPNNTQIVASAYSKNMKLRSIYIVMIESGKVRLIQTDSNFNDYPIWSLDGSNIACVCRNDDMESIWLMSVEGDVRKKITRHLFSKIRNLDWSKDGSRIVFNVDCPSSSSKKQIWVVSSYGKYEYMILDNHLSYPQWISDDEILCCKSTRCFANLKVIGINDRQNDFITQQIMNQYDVKPIWHHAKNLIVFERNNKIWMTSYLDKKEQILVEEDGFNPSLSPDGSKLLYNNYQDIFLKDLKTGETINLTNKIDETYSEPIWSPSGKHIAFKSPGGLSIVSIDSMTINEMFHIEGTFYNLCWSPINSLSGSCIAYDNKHDVYIITLSAQKLVPGIHGATAPCWSPDGTKLAYVYKNQIRIKKIFEDLNGE